MALKVRENINSNFTMQGSAISAGSIVFSEGDDLTSEKKTDDITLGSIIAPVDNLFLLSIEKPIENTAGNLTIYVYNVIKIDETNARDVLHSTHTVEKITDSATYRDFIIQGLFIGEEKVKIGAAFAADSSAITVAYRLYRL